MTDTHAAQDERYVQYAAEQIEAALQQSGPLPGGDAAMVVPNEGVAEAIHFVIAWSIYGEEKIRNQRPFRAVRSGEFWVVLGSLTPKTLGGTAITVIRARNGEILRVTHGR